MNQVIHFLRMRVNFKLAILYIILLFATVSIEAQSLQVQVEENSYLEVEPLEFDTTHIKEYQNNSDYKYLEDAEFEENLLSKLLYRLVKWIANSTGLKFGNGLFQFFKYLFIFLAGYLMIRFFLNSTHGGFIKKKDPDISKIDAELVDADMSAMDLSKLIEEAESRKAFRLAIRFNYLKLLRTLDDKQLIHWKTEKTNSDFIAEMHSTVHGAVFREITQLYEYVWYGEFELSNEEEYLHNRNGFDRLYQKIAAR